MAYRAQPVVTPKICLATISFGREVVRYIPIMRDANYYEKIPVKYRKHRHVNVATLLGI